MPIPAEARFWMSRARGLWRRGLASLRNRGLAASWQRLKLQFRRGRVVTHVPYSPDGTPFTPFAMPATDTPRASIVIPVHGAFAHTLACLRAIAAHPPAAGIEVIVVDDASPDDSRARLLQIDGIHLHARDSNGGFIAACNDGAAMARGEYLVFLNNDTVPQPGWLDALLGTFEEHAEAGLVGAKLVYPDGRLQEAGGVVFADGSGWNYGRHEDPTDCRFNYLRDADYLSGAAIMVPRALFQQLGGFDARYAPAYYEDTDLAFAVRAAGLRVLCQPQAVVHARRRHYGRNRSEQWRKASQRRNQQVFADKWRAALAKQLPAGSIPTPALLHRRQQQVLIIDALTPQPDRDSGSLRLVNLMRMLIAVGVHVVASCQPIAPPTGNTRKRCSNSASNAGMRRMPRGSRPGCASTDRASIRCWSAGTTWRASSCHCCASTHRRRASCSTPSICTTCANAVPPSCRAMRLPCARPKAPASWNWN